MKIRIGEEVFNIKKATTKESRKRGLKKIKNLPKQAGLLLEFDSAKIISITMEDVRFPLDIIFLNDGEVVDMQRLNVGDEDIQSKVDADKVLEVNAGESSNINIGDKVSYIGVKHEDGTIETTDKLENGLNVLDEDGNVQAILEGDERVYSRKHTKRLVELAMQANNSGSEADYKKVGKFMVKVINKQDTQESQYSKN